MPAKRNTTKSKRNAPPPLHPDELDPVKHPFFSARRLSQIGFGDHGVILQAVKARTIPSIRYQRDYRIPTRWVREALGLPAELDAQPVSQSSSNVSRPPELDAQPVSQSSSNVSRAPPG
jgi:hypothetical protein